MLSWIHYLLYFLEGSLSPCCFVVWPHQWHTTHAQTHTHRVNLSHCLCSGSLIVLCHPLVSWPYLCSCQMDKATVHSCILSPSATHNWTVRLIARADLLWFTFPLCLSHFITCSCSSLLKPICPVLSPCPCYPLLPNPCLSLSRSDPLLCI